jgi:hypothetical protein
MNASDENRFEPNLNAGLKNNLLISFLSLFTSGSTLICCALPALLVSIGAGAAMAGLVGTFPQLVWISEHKTPLFLFAAIMLVGAGMMQWRARSLPCPVEPKLALACVRARKMSFYIYIISVAIFLVGFFFAFVAPLFFE